MKKVDARTIQAGNFQAASIQSRPCTKDCHLFLHLKKIFGQEVWGVTDGKKKDVAQDWQKSLAAVCDAGIAKLVPIYAP